MEEQFDPAVHSSFFTSVEQHLRAKEDSEDISSVTCIKCGVLYESVNSLSVHLSYHKENLDSTLNSTTPIEEEDNNNKKTDKPEEEKVDEMENTENIQNHANDYLNPFVGYSTDITHYQSLPPFHHYNSRFQNFDPRYIQLQGNQQINGGSGNNEGYSPVFYNLKHEQTNDPEILDLDSKKLVYTQQQLVQQSEQLQLQQLHSQHQVELLVQQQSDQPMLHNHHQSEQLHLNQHQSEQLHLNQHQSEQLHLNHQSEQMIINQHHSEQLHLRLHQSEQDQQSQVVDDAIYMQGGYFKEENESPSPTDSYVGNNVHTPLQPHPSPGPPESPFCDNNSIQMLTLGAQPPTTKYQQSKGGGPWKSNEARRPKTYKCPSCNKWFTSSGHLKRHYNTTLHKNAVKQSGISDPALEPISNHHHPPGQQEQEKYYSQQQHQMQHQAQMPIQAMPQPTIEEATAQQLALMQQIHPQEYQEFYGYPNGQPPHTINFNPEPLPSFAQIQTTISNGYQSVGGHASSVQQPQELKQELTMELSIQLDDSLDVISTEFQSVNIGESPLTAKPSSQKKKCLACKKSFNKACYLTQHNKSFHMGAKPFKCARCGKRFKTQEIREQHFKKHAGNKPFPCDHCPKQFNHKTDLRRHMCLHTGTKPFKCVYCEKGFIRKDHMLKHEETHKKKAAAELAKRNMNRNTYQSYSGSKSDYYEGTTIPMPYDTTVQHQL